MFIGHPAAGYVWTRFLLKKGVLNGSAGIEYHACLLLGLISSVLPDFDLLYFFFIDFKKHTHHTFLPHIPAFWVIIAIISMLLCIIFKNRQLKKVSLIIISNVVIHLLLDTISGGIYWLYPFSGQECTVFEIRTKYDMWVLNYFLHWSFVGEVILVMAGIFVFFRKKAAVYPFLKMCVTGNKTMYCLNQIKDISRNEFFQNKTF